MIDDDQPDLKFKQPHCNTVQQPPEHCSVMTISHQPLPLEVVEIIIEFSSQYNRKIPILDFSDCKNTLLQCALVCRMWLWPARRFLEQTFLDLERISISPRCIEDLALFGSPLCTLDSDLVQELVIHRSDRTHRPERGEEVFISVFTLLSALGRATLPSLQEISFQGVLLDLSHSEHPNFPPDNLVTTSRSNIKILVIDGDDHFNSYENIVHTASLFPSLEELFVNQDHWDNYRHDTIISFTPPLSLRKLRVDPLSLVCVVMDWLVPCGSFDLTNIVSVSIFGGDIGWEDPSIVDRLPWVLKLLRPNLEEFELRACQYNICLFFSLD